MVEMTAQHSLVAPLPDRSVVPAVWGRVTNIAVDRGEGSWLVTTDGERYLDYSSGIGVTNTGHAHPRVVAAVQEQAARLLHGQQNIVYHEAGLRLYDRLRTLLPGGPWQAFLSNSGAEAVEAAEHIGYPVAMKVVSPDIVHKTDIGGVRVGCGKPMASAIEPMNFRFDTNSPSVRWNAAWPPRVTRKRLIWGCNVWHIWGCR